MSKLFWLTDAQWAQIDPYVPTNQPGARRVDDRRVISGIIHVLKTGCRWCDCPAAYGPHTTVYNRFNRWSRRRFWATLVETLAICGAVTKSTAIDSTYVKAHRSAHGGKGGRKIRLSAPRAEARRPRSTPLTDALGRPYAFHLTAGNVSDVKAAVLLLPRACGARYLLADKGYDANSIRKSLRGAGAVPVIPGRANRKRKIVYDKTRYRHRHLIENAFCRLKDFRRVATRYDKLARNFLSAIALATLVAFWL